VIDCDRLRVASGGAIAIAGFALVTAFLGGHRGSDAILAAFLEPLTARKRALGVLVGLLAVGVGLLLIRRTGGRPPLDD
jgi:hypothetical protein